MTFDLEQFIADCRVALAANRAQKCVREVVARAVSNPASVLKVLGEPRHGTFQTLYHAHDLTIVNIVWEPHLVRPPHNHQMWGVIGIYTGREDNIFLAPRRRR
jgi:predicted metal-dependent enzyme (double-stranded beta helix superfamily)